MEAADSSIQDDNFIFELIIKKSGQTILGALPWGYYVYLVWVNSVLDVSGANLFLVFLVLNFRFWVDHSHYFQGNCVFASLF